MQNRIVIIDPTSPEFNRGSFCYLPYLLFCALKAKGYEVELVEDFSVANIDKLPPADQYLVALWSYPQIEACLVLNKFLPGKPQFFGYYALCREYNLSVYEVQSESILIGMSNYPKYYRHFTHLLLSDCDMHLKKYDGQVYPLFTSYGCPKGCAFCPSTANTNRKRHALPTIEVTEMLKACNGQGIKNIHFTDEDFFFNTHRARLILEEARDIGGFNFIALGSVETVQRFINMPGGAELLERSGVRLIEVGFETADDELSKKMGKGGVDAYSKLAASCPVDIFWLTLTFFPGETISTLNKTGEFLRQHGFQMEELYGRIQTNGTVGGLGQFFQPYHGTKGFKRIKQQGRAISTRPLRLLPSFIPFSFLDSRIKQHVRGVTKEDKKWFDLYRVPVPQYYEKHPIWLNIAQTVDYDNNMAVADLAVAYALCARLGIIK